MKWRAQDHNTFGENVSFDKCLSSAHEAVWGLNQYSSVKLIKSKFTIQPLCFDNLKSSLNLFAMYTDKHTGFPPFYMWTVVHFKYLLMDLKLLTHIHWMFLTLHLQKKVGRVIDMCTEVKNHEWIILSAPFKPPFLSLHYLFNFHTKQQAHRTVCMCVCHSRLVLCSACLSLFVWLARGS